MNQTQTCYTCGAVIDCGYSGRHTQFHRDVERKVQELEEQVRRLKRAVRG